MLNGFIQTDYGPAGEDAYRILIPNAVPFECSDRVVVYPRFWSNRLVDGTAVPDVGYDATIGCLELDPFCLFGFVLNPGLVAGGLQAVITAEYLAHTTPIALGSDVEIVGSGAYLSFWIPGHDIHRFQFSLHLHKP